MFEFELMNGETYISDDDFSLLISKKLSKEDTIKQFEVEDVKPRIVNEENKLGYIGLDGTFTMLEEYQLLDVIDNGIVSVKRDNKVGAINIGDIVNKFGYVVVNNNTTMEMFMVRKIGKSYEQEPNFISKTR